MSTYKRVIQLTVFAVAFWFSAAAAIAIDGLSDTEAVADMVVVPGNTVYPDGSLSPRLKARLDTAFALYQQQRCRVIFVSGATGKERVDEAVAMESYLLALGVPGQDIVRDSAGVNTRATAEHAAAVMQTRSLTTVIAASQFFHITRLRILLEQSGVGVAGTAHAQYFELRDVYALLREVAAMGALGVRTLVD